MNSFTSIFVICSGVSDSFDDKTPSKVIYWLKWVFVQINESSEIRDVIYFLGKNGMCFNKDERTMIC